MQKVTFAQFQDFAAKELFSFGRDVYSGSFAIIRNNKAKPSPNKNKPIAFVDELISNGVLPISYRALLNGPAIIVHVSIFHKEGGGIRRLDGVGKREVRKQVLEYFRKVHEQKTSMQGQQIRYFGGF